MARVYLFGWCLASNESKDQITSYISSSESSLLEVLELNSRTCYVWLQSGYEFLFAVWSAFCDSFTNIMSFCFDSAILMFESLITFLCNALSYLTSWIWLAANGISNVCSFFFEGIIASLTNVGHFLWYIKSPVEYIIDGEPRTMETKAVKDDVSSVTIDDDSFTFILKRVADLEGRLKTEVALRETEQLKMESNVKQYLQLLQDQRVDSRAMLRRCCRWPCSTPQSVLTETPTPDFNRVIEDVDSLVAEVRQQSAADIESLRAEIYKVVATDKRSAVIDGSVDWTAINKIIAQAIKLYDADKTGRADYALESAGGRVVSIRCTKTYSNKAYPVLGIPLFWVASSSPEDAIRPGTAPGECWAFQGSVGYLALELSYPVKVTGFTMEHISRALSPSGSIDSAPRHFSMWGLSSADDLYDQYLFGEYVYEDSGETVQYFPVQNPTETIYKFVELKIISNHGHPEYTCLYRIRVHSQVT